MTEPTSDPARLVAALARDAISLELKTIDLCFLATLHLRADRGALASFDEAQMMDLFEQVCELVEARAENPRKRATHAIQRLRDQRMLARVDGGGLVRAGEYTLTGLAVAIVQFLLADEALTRESLTLLTGTLMLSLSEIRTAASRADTAERWRDTVIGPLRVTVVELVGGIERRRRGLDRQQEEIQREIAELLQADWLGSVDRCQALLEATTNTLAELGQILLKDCQQFLVLLQEVQQHAVNARVVEAEEASQRVIEHVDGILAWASTRQAAWSTYYQYVHRFLREVVRLDPERALSQRLRDQLAGWLDRPHALVAAAEPSIVLLRPVEAREERLPVQQRRRLRDRDPDEVPPSTTERDLEARVREGLDAGVDRLSELIAWAAADEHADRHYLLAGRVTELAARLAEPRSPRERAWTPTGLGFEVEDWSLVRTEEIP